MNFCDQISVRVEHTDLGLENKEEGRGKIGDQANWLRRSPERGLEASAQARETLVGSAQPRESLVASAQGLGWLWVVAVLVGIGCWWWLCG